MRVARLLLVVALATFASAHAQAQTCGGVFAEPYSQCDLSVDVSGQSRYWCCWYVSVRACGTGEVLELGTGPFETHYWPNGTTSDPDYKYTKACGWDARPALTTDANAIIEVWYSDIANVRYYSQACSPDAVTFCEEEICDGVDNNGNGFADEGCDDDCRDQDGAPCHFRTGQVHSTPRVDFELPTYDGIPLEFTRRWVQHDPTRPPKAGQALLTDWTEKPTFVGYGWRFTYDDVVAGPYVPFSSLTTGRPDVLSWKGDQSISFKPQSYVAARQVTSSSPVEPAYWRYFGEDGEDLELRYYGCDLSPAPAGCTASSPNMQVIRHSAGTVYDFSYIPGAFRVSSSSKNVAFLTRIGKALGWSSTTPGYYVRIERSSTTAAILRIIDVEGRQLSFAYEAEAAGVSRKLKAIVATKGTSTLPLVTFSYCTDSLACTALDGAHPAANYLERVDYFTGGYERYVYADVVSADGKKRRHLETLVRSQGNCASGGGVCPTPNQVGIATGEVIVERHFYRPDGRAKSTWTATHKFGYDYRPDTTLQFDLNVVSGPYCDASDTACPLGMGCWKKTPEVGGDGFCYPKTGIAFDPGTGHVATKAGACPDCGGDVSFYLLTDPARGRIRAITRPGGLKTSISWTKDGRPHCVVVGDDNDVAESADGTCSAPTGAVVNDYSFVGNMWSLTRPSRVAAGQTWYASMTFDSLGRLRSTGDDVWTRNLDSTSPTFQTIRTYLSYDSLGRLMRYEGPLHSGVLHDVVEFTYHPSSDSLDAYRLYQVKRFAGAAGQCPSGSGCVVLTTTLSNYDWFGVPRSITDEQGVLRTLTTDALGRVTRVTVKNQSPYSLAAERQYAYNLDGSLSAVWDNDGICTVLSYDPTGRLAGKKRGAGTSASDCRKYLTTTAPESETLMLDAEGRVVKITREEAGTKRYEQQFQYDAYSRLSFSSTSGSLGRVYSYSADGVLAGIEEANCRIAGSPTCTRSTFGIDLFGRRTRESRRVDAVSNQVTTFAFESPDPRPLLRMNGTLDTLPTQVGTGDGTSTRTTTWFVYDDAGRTIEYGSPDSGALGLEYNAAGWVTRSRRAAGTAEQATTRYTYDSLGRVLAVDHDLEHPVDCATAVEGTAIADEEYVYDTCPTQLGVPSYFSCGNYQKGQLSVATVKLSCKGGAPLVRRQWHSYDDLGRLDTTSIVDGNATLTPRKTSYVYSAAGRRTKTYNPLSVAYSQVNLLNPGSGEVSDVQDTFRKSYATGIKRAPFGPLRSYTTGITSLKSDGTTEKLQRSLGRDLLYRLTSAITYAGSMYRGASFVYYRNALGDVTSRTSVPYQIYNSATKTYLAQNAFASRKYLYDNLDQLTCEAKALNADGSCPGSGSASLLGKYEYFYGSDGNAPGNRKSAEFASAEQSTTVKNAYVLGADTNQLSRIDRGASGLDFYHDGLGRRTKDDDSGFIGEKDDARTFYYLPSGRLGTIKGTIPYTGCIWDGGAMHCYTAIATYWMTYAYDHKGRAFSATYRQSNWSYRRVYELYYDEDDRLIAAKVTPNDSVPSTYQRWSYFHLDAEPIAAVLENVSSSGTTVTRLWFLNDEHGTPFQAMAEDTTVLYAADFDAFGWRHVKTQASGIWVPFGLPGQVIFDETTVKAATSSCSTMGLCTVVYLRPPIALHGQRDYDPYVGRFIETDPTDVTITMRTPEQYAYAWNNPLRYIDPMGTTPKWCPLAPLAPPGADVDDNIDEAFQNWIENPFLRYWFYKKVRNRGPWDYKQKGKQYEAFGNFNYGATGVAAGFPDRVLLWMAGWAQIQAGTSKPEWRSTYGDDPRDQEMINQGILYYRNDCGCQ